MATHEGVIKAIVGSFFFRYNSLQDNNKKNNNNNDLLTVFLHGSSASVILTKN